MKKINFIPVLTAILAVCMLVSCKKDDPKPAELISISVKTEPTKIEYYVGDALDLSGLIVTLTMDNGDNNDSPFSDFTSNGITNVPANGEVITVESTLVTITHTTTNKSVSQSISQITLQDIDNNIYPLVKLGSQVWMAKNLKVIHYTDGTEIPLVSDDDEWNNLEDNNIDKGFCYYNNNSNNEAETYGALYTWAAAMNGASSSNTNPSNVQGVCPDGWHLPSDDEWTELVDYLAEEGFGYEGSGIDVSKSVATTSLWEVSEIHGSPGNDLSSNNSSGFSAVPSGYRMSVSGIFNYEKTHCYWWSTTEYNDVTSLYRNVYYESAEIYRSNSMKSIGFSVRCVKD